MNGQERKLISKVHSDLSNQLTDLQARFEERWESHNARAQEFIKLNKEDHAKIFKWLEVLPCKERRWMSKAIYGIYGLIGGAVAIAIKHIVLNGH